jgi:hypothetical protein
VSGNDGRTGEADDPAVRSPPGNMLRRRLISTSTLTRPP